MFPTPAIARWSSRNALTARAAPARQLAQQRRGQRAVERLDAEAARRRTRRARRSERELAGAEAPRVAEAQLVAVVEREAHALVGVPGGGS
jgi:hypothetical protein